MPHPPTCSLCGLPKVYVDEALVSGFRGWLCANEDCMMDG
jgi:alpha-D-ribose 1-methylphosphonate 5-phosphate C-P lyase